MGEGREGGSRGVHVPGVGVDDDLALGPSVVVKSAEHHTERSSHSVIDSSDLAAHLWLDLYCLHLRVAAIKGGAEWLFCRLGS